MFGVLVQSEEAKVAGGKTLKEVNPDVVSLG